MNTDVQHYWAPFPKDEFWKEDFARIKNTGENTVQHWVLWVWAEPEPGKLVFDDYDPLVHLISDKRVSRSGTHVGQECQLTTSEWRSSVLSER